MPPNFNDRFGGSSIKPSDVSYRYVVLNANEEVQWPEQASDGKVLARTMEVVASVGSLGLTLPDARESSPGTQFVFYNSGAFSYSVLSNDATPLMTIEPGGRRLLELTNNETQGGAWISTLLGVGTGALDVAGAAGAGLIALGTTLNVAFRVETFSVSRIATETDRDKVMVWTGGTGEVTLPLSASVPFFNFEVRNQGTGALTIATSGGEEIDGIPSIVLNNNESCWIHAGTGSWFTIGRGRNAQFNFTQLNKTVTGGNVVLTLTEASNVVQTYTGVLTSNVDIVLPSVVQVYYISNQTTGPFNFRIRTAFTGSTISLPSGQNAVIFCDGQNVINASTTVAGIGQITFGAGSESAPSVAIGASNNGLYAPSSTSVGFTAGGATVAVMDSTGLRVEKAGNAANGVTSTSADAFFRASRPAGAQAGLNLNTVNTPRWFAGVTADSEAGANAGSNFAISRYNDAGALIDTPFSINRATGVASVIGLRDKAQIGTVVAFIGDATPREGHIYLDGSILNRATYPDLFAYAQASGLVSEVDWAGGLYGRFSVGNGTTTFRVPDTRAMVIRGLDSGRGLDTGRLWGSFQDQSNAPHTHGVNDPGHGHTTPAHSHGVSDPGHGHGGATSVNGHHGHGYTGWANTGGGAGYGAFSVWNPTGASTDGAGDHNHSVTVYGAGTGIWINAAGVAVNGSYTGVTIQSNGLEARMRNIAYPLYTRF